MEQINKRSFSADQIGKKIRKQRLSCGMTQKELAGDVISRNMLSMIESGNALPSLETLIHISETLSVSPAFFFADDTEIKLFGKNQDIGTVYNYIDSAEYQKAAELCLGYADTDTEMRTLLTLSYMKAAEAFIDKYMLSSAAAYLQSAAEYAKSIPYLGQRIDRACTYTLTLFDCVSKDILPDIPTDTGTFTGIPYTFLAYISACKLLIDGDVDAASAIVRSGMLSEFYSLHIRGSIVMKSGDYESATTLLDLALTSEGGGFFSRYRLLRDLEICRKNVGNFEQAYALSTSRMEMLGMFSK